MRVLNPKPYTLNPGLACGAGIHPSPHASPFGVCSSACTSDTILRLSVAVMYLPQLMEAVNPETVVLLTLRDPKAWYKSRTEQKFGAEKLCRKDLWDTVAHPFSVGECVNMRGRDGLVKLAELGEEDGCEAFIRYNSWVAAVVPHRQLVRFCLWDCDDSGACGHEEKLRRLYALLLQRALLLKTPFALRAHQGAEDEARSGETGSV